MVSHNALVPPKILRMMNGDDRMNKETKGVDDGIGVRSVKIVQVVEPVESPGRMVKSESSMGQHVK